MIKSDIGMEHKNIINIENRDLMLSKLFQSQGMYEGFFNYQNKQISERFTIILRKKIEFQLSDIGKDKSTARLTMLGYGENNEMGPFILEGYCEVTGMNELTEKEGLKVEKSSQQEPMFMKLKIAKFVLKKIYQTKTLKELVHDKKAYREKF